MAVGDLLSVAALKLNGDSSLHFVSLRMTDTYVFEEELSGENGHSPFSPDNS